MHLHTENLPPLRKACVFIGIGLLILSLMLFFSSIIGVFELESFAVMGHSGIRMLAAIAIAGCLLAAVGYFDE